MRLRTIIWVDEPQVNHDSVDDYEIGGDIVALAPAHTGAKNSKMVFEDRSHVYQIIPRPDDPKNSGYIPDDLDIHNIVVRGKRGNIVQTHPNLEYDFVPNRLNIKEGAAVQIQWTGSNTHNNQGLAGDGQAGDDGTGTGGTDRSNFIQLADRTGNWPAPFEAHDLFGNAEWVWSSHSRGKPEDKQINLSLSHATSGYYQCVNGADCRNNAHGKKQHINNELNNVSPSYQGNVFIPAPGEYHYVCMRNNNFSNRSHKGQLIVEKAGPPTGAFPAMMPARRVRREEKPKGCQ